MNRHAFVESVDPILLSGFTDIRREATRPVEHREVGFASTYDDNTLFFDAFLVERRRALVALGPSFNNIDKYMRAAVCVDASTGRKLDFRVRNLDRHSQFWIDSPGVLDEVKIFTSIGSFSILAKKSDANTFNGRRVLLTQSKDNPIEWILDWVRFNRDVHKADAVLLYDNGSARYAPKDILEACCRIKDISVIGVVDWPFKYGPQGSGWKKHWDSNYCQLGSLEHARWRHLQNARSVMFSDIDELVVGRPGIFERVEGSVAGVSRYYGSWALGDQDYSKIPADQRRHRDILTVMKPKYRPSKTGVIVDKNRCNSKWTLVPRRCPDFAQWHVHKIRAWPLSFVTSRKHSLRHFRPISTGWKYNRECKDDTGLRHCRRDGGLASLFSSVRWDH